MWRIGFILQLFSFFLSTTLSSMAVAVVFSPQSFWEKDVRGFVNSKWATPKALWASPPKNLWMDKDGVTKEVPHVCLYEEDFNSVWNY